jgi:hypothetical protein
MAGHAPVIVHPLSPDGGRRVTIRDEAVGSAYNLFDLLEYLRRAELPEADTAIDDPDLIEWRGGGPEVWADPQP